MSRHQDYQLDIQQQLNQHDREKKKLERENKRTMK
jgi:hypothetical protein